MADPRICSIEGCGKPHDARGWCCAHHRRWRRHGDPLAGGTPRGEPERYFREIVLPFVEVECLIWPYARSSSGYGHVRQNGRMQLVHRLACEAIHGSPPTPEHEAAHSCGKGHKGCCNPRHVRWATHAENHEDRLLHGTHNRGERCGAAKLNESDVLKIRALRGKMLQREIAEKFGVDQSQVSNIYRGESWGWLGSDPKLRESGSALVAHATSR